MKIKLKDPLDVFKSAETTGNLIKSWRINFDVPQDDMAFACGISQANLSSIENNRRDVGSRVALRLSAFMGIAPEIILYPKGFEQEPEFKEVIRRKEKIKNIAV
jgi:transcriptional regulator with XRE-family HTH domain